MNRRPDVRHLVLVELRKAVDTRAGVWLLGVTVLLTGVVVALQVAFGKPAENTLASLALAAQLPGMVLLPVIGVLSVTSEWSQRTALATFALVPIRSRVVAAKALAGGVIALVAVVAGLVDGVLGFAVGGLLDRTDGRWSVSAWLVPDVALAQLINMAMGLAFGLLILASAPAIVTLFAVPTAWSVTAGLVPGLARVAPWLDLSQASGPLTGAAAALTGHQWLQLLTATALWVALPAVAGLARLHRTEVA